MKSVVPLGWWGDRTKAKIEKRAAVRDMRGGGIVGKRASRGTALEKPLGGVGRNGVFS